MDWMKLVSIRFYCPLRIVTKLKTCHSRQFFLSDDGFTKEIKIMGAAFLSASAL